jgi:hypothetical protein
MTRTRATKPAHEPSLRSVLLYFAAVRGMQKAGPKIGTGADLGALGGTRTSSLLIRSDLQPRPLSGRSGADLLNDPSMTRSKRQH